MGCPALLSVVSQLLSVCNPADFLVRLQRGATPVAACLQAPAELCKAVAAASQVFGNRLSVFPDCQNYVSTRDVLLSPPHAALRADRLACRPSRKAYQRSAICPMAKKILSITRPASCSLSGVCTALIERRCKRSHSFSRPASCSLPSISACRAKDTPTIERIINAFVP